MPSSSLSLRLRQAFVLASTCALAVYGATLWWPEMLLLGRRGLGVDALTLAGSGLALLAASWRAVLGAAVLLAAAEALGWCACWLGRLGAPPASLRVLLGLPLLALGGLALGAAGWLGAGPVWTGALTALALRAWTLQASLRRMIVNRRSPADAGPTALAAAGASRRVAALALGALALAAWPTIVALLHPTIFYDALVYHLALPKAYLLSGSTAPLPWNVYSHFPSCGELLFTLAWALGGQLAAQLLALAWWALGCLALGQAARAAGGPLAGRWGLALAALTPCFLSGAGLVGVDVLAAALSAGAAWAVARLFAAEGHRGEWPLGVPVTAVAPDSLLSRRGNEGAAAAGEPRPATPVGASSARVAAPSLIGPTPAVGASVDIDALDSAPSLAAAPPATQRAYVCLAALFAAAAGSCKPTALALVGVPAACAALLALYQGRLRPRDLGAAAAGAAVLLLPWLLRSAWATGNPLYPLPLLGASLPAAVYQAMQQDAHAGAFDPAAWWRMLFAAPMAQQREFGVAALVGLAPLVGWPAWAVSRPPFVQRVLAGMLAASLVIWLATFHVTRFAFPAVGLAVVLSACGLAQLQAQGARRLAFAAVAVVLAGHAGMNLAYNAYQAAWLTQGFARLRLGLDADAYLALRARDRPVELGSLRAVQALQRAEAGPLRLLTVGEPASLYLPGEAVAPTGVDGSPLLDLLATEPAAAVRDALLARGVTHVLHRPEELRRLATQYGWPITPQQDEALAEFIALLGKPQRAAGPAQLYRLSAAAAPAPAPGDPAAEAAPATAAD